MQDEGFSPKEFLKLRRPERFSDSEYREVTELDRSLLEYHLDSLTSRGQETDFERFAKRLAEHEICPNLLPQTGPTGGGDSKVDSETYPVADSLALSWFSGIGREASQERWAFAFSAKKQWRPKIKSDIAKIAATERNYTKAFFVTNQTVSDKKRAELEDGLSKEHGLDVRILDRTWILDKVFSNNRESLAIDELGVTGLSRRDLRKGPQDISREDELVEVEARIEEMLNSGARGHALVDDCLAAADLARQLERPRPEVEGRYARLDKLALDYGSFRQQVESAYQWAWTLYWWFEDFPAFIKQYIVVEERAKDSRNAYDFERLYSLWPILFTLSTQEHNIDIDRHTQLLKTELKRLSKEVDRPSTALQAETFLIQIELFECRKQGEDLDAPLKALTSVVQRSKGLVGYPLDPLVQTLTDIGEGLEGSDAYDELFETIISVSSTRDGEVKAAQLLLRRGDGQLKQERTIEAIATLGRALGMLYKHETRYEIILALYLCGTAYEVAGLPWAARGTLINAASIAANDLWSYGNVTPQQVICAWKLKWLELRLGRLPQLLVWHEVSRTMNHVLEQKGYENLIPEDNEFDVLLARLLLRTEYSMLASLEKLPDTLVQLGLPFAAESLLYALGHEEEFAESAEIANQEPKAFALGFKNLKADASLAEKPKLYNEGSVALHTKILGCRVEVKTDVNSPAKEVAESFLAALEGFLATTVLRSAIAREPSLSVEVEVVAGLDKMVESTIEERGGRPHLTIQCQDFDPHDISAEKTHEFGNDLFQVVVEALSNVIMFKDSEKDIEALFQEKIVDRAISFTRTVGTQANVLGFEPKTQLATWIDPAAKLYPLERAEPWDAGESDIELEKAHQPLKQAAPNEEPPPELLDPNQMTHEEMEVISLIRERLWNRAGWSGAFFMRYEGAHYPPILGLIFRDRDSGSAIFRHWLNEFGKADVHEKFRVVIVKGIDKNHPYAYRIVIGPDPEAYDLKGRYFTFMYRAHRMDAVTPQNVDDFIEHHEIIGSFFLAPAFVSDDWDEATAPDIELDLRILIRRVHVRNAWEIGLNDTDASGIQQDDDPIIPEGIEDAPVLKVFDRENRK